LRSIQRRPFWEAAATTRPQNYGSKIEYLYFKMETSTFVIIILLQIYISYITTIYLRKY